MGTIVCAIFTAKDVVPYDECNPHFRTRTDARLDVLEKSSWFYFPYPGIYTLYILRCIGRYRQPFNMCIQ